MRGLFRLGLLWWIRVCKGVGVCGGDVLASVVNFLTPDWAFCEAWCPGFEFTFRKFRVAHVC